MRYPLQQKYVEAVLANRQNQSAKAGAGDTIAVEHRYVSSQTERGQQIWLRSLLVLLFMGGLLGSCCKPIVAEEPALEFLDGLRARGYHDTALEYLKSLETSRLLPAGMRDVLGYETALTLVIASRDSSELEERYKMLDEAHKYRLFLRKRQVGKAIIAIEKAHEVRMLQPCALT